MSSTSKFVIACTLPLIASVGVTQAKQPVSAASAITQKPAVPAAFDKAVKDRMAKDKLSLSAWWQDDLDGDKDPDLVAFLCNDTSGLYLVLHQGKWLEAAREMDGKNSCVHSPPGTTQPAWRQQTTGNIEDVYLHHGGSVKTMLAIREGALVVVKTEASGRSQNENYYELADYEARTLTVQAGKRKKKTSPAVVLNSALPTSVDGLEILATNSTGNHNAATIFKIKATKGAVIKACDDSLDRAATCQTTKITGAGEAEVMGFTLEIRGAKKKFPVGILEFAADAGQKLPRAAKALTY